MSVTIKKHEIEIGEMMRLVQEAFKVLKSDPAMRTVINQHSLQFLEHCMADLFAGISSMAETLGETTSSGYVAGDKFAILKKGKKHDRKSN